MGPEKEKKLFKKGIWIKEQQGILTMGSLDRNSKDIMVIPDELSSKLLKIEFDMVEALYGENKKAFQPETFNIEILFDKLKDQFKEVDLKISFKNPDNVLLKSDFNSVFSLFKKLIISSTLHDRSPSVYIKASILDNDLCIIYQDSESYSDPSDLGSDFFLTKSKLNGSVQFQKTETGQTYYDIMIPLNE